MGGTRGAWSTTLMGACRTAVAMSLLAGDLTIRGIARHGEMGLDEAERHLASAREAGVVDLEGRVDELQRARLTAELTPEQRAQVHSKAAAHLLAEGPARLADALHHLEAAATLSDPEAAIELADRSGRLSLSLGDYASAQALLALAAQYDVSSDLARQGHRLCDLAAATGGVGDLREARRHLARAVTLGELARDPGLVARAAVAHTLPVDWNAGDQRTTGLLQRAAGMELSRDDRVAVLAARAMADMRIPVIAGEHQQVAWVTRPAVARPLAEQALVDSAGCAPWVQCLAALAWRSTHRAPQFLERRREVSTQAMQWARQLRHPGFQVEAAMWMAVDGLEAGDRTVFEEGLSESRWIAQNDGNPHLQFRALTLAMGASLLDGDHSRVHELLEQTHAIVARLDQSLVLVVKSFFLGQLAISDDDLAVMKGLAPEPNAPTLVHPLGRAATAYVWARTGRTELAVEHTRRALVQRDDESSLLLVATRAAAVAAEVGDPELCGDVLGLLTPFADRVAVDSNGWWCDGPVALWLAVLHHRLGHDAAAYSYLKQAEPVARSLRDVRGLRRMEALRALLPAVDDAAWTAATALSERERAVLQQLATGATNAQIAQLLAFSVSTIRNDTIAIYRKLGVTGRPDAVARGVSLGVIQPAW